MTSTSTSTEGNAALVWLSSHKRAVGIITVLAVLAAVIFVTTRSGSAANGDGDRIVVAPVESRTLQETVSVQGEVRHNETGSLNMLAAGRITALEVEDGDTVAAGEEVVAVDGRPAVAVQGDMPFWRPLEEGGIGFDVLQLEEILAAEGFDPGEVDLDFTAQTREALLAWQEQYGYSRPEPEDEETVVMSLVGSGPGYEIGPQNAAAGRIVEEPGGAPQAVGPPPPDTGPEADDASSEATKPRRNLGARGPGRVAGADTPTVSILASPLDVTEGDVTRLIFTSDIDSTSNLQIRYSVSGSATGGADYDIVSGVAILEEGESQVELFVQTFDDGVLEPDETVTVRITAAGGYRTGAQDRVTITIEDATVPEITVETTQSSVAEGGVARFTVRSDQKLLDDTQIDLTTAGSATAEDDYEPLDPEFVIIKGGRDSADVAIPVYVDGTLEDEETLSLQLQVSQDILNGAYTLGSVTSADVDIIDNVSGLPAMTILADDLEVSEGDVATFTVEADTGISENIEVWYATSGTTTDGQDYTLDTKTRINVTGSDPEDPVVVAEGTINIALDQDGDVEQDETLTVRLLPSPDGSYVLGARSSDTVTVESGDDPEVTVVGGGTVFEGGAISFAIQTDQPFAETTSVAYSIGGTATDGADYKSVDGVAIFSPGMSSVSVTLWTIDDDAVFQPGDMIVDEWPSRIGTVQVDKGEFVAEGSPLMTLTEDVLTVVLSMSPTERARLSEGLEGEVELTASGEVAPGEIVELDDTAESGEGDGESYSGEVEVQGELEAVDGAGVNMDIVLEESKDALAVPVASLVGVGDITEVRVVEEDGSITRVAVETGITDGAFTEVTSGLRGDERVVVEVGAS